MCGIAGIMQRDGASVDGALLEAMTTVQAHRGPDGEGYVLLDPSGKEKPFAVAGSLRGALGSRSGRAGPYRVGFGHRRLAIVDITPLGHQPMGSEDGSAWITYNGEIYNYVELREELRRLGRRFCSHSDTEVVLAAYQQWGVACLQRFNGMFAFALWDATRRRLVCARDRFGMKPFYYQVTPDRILFASEIKALLANRAMPAEPNLRRVHDFLVLGLQDHTAETLFNGVTQLRPGHLLVIDGDRMEVTPWWDLSHPSAPSDLTDDSAEELVRRLMTDAVRVHLRSDVQVGSCLSGGLDSSTIVCTMRQFMEQPIHTFSSCFDDPECDERPYIEAVVERTGAESLQVFPDGPRLIEEMPRFLWFQDEPVGGTSYLAQWAVMRAASERGVKVLLDGQGGDELLCGYPGYWGSYAADLLKAGQLGRAIRELRAYRRRRGGLHPTVAGNLARALLPASVVSSARSWLKGHARWINREFARHFQTDSGYPRRFGSALDNHTAAYLATHSLPALLHHEDRSAMAFSVEARLPFLDTRLMEGLVSLPARFKLRDGLDKYVLRQAMTGVIPESVRTRRDKVGFATPERRWLRETFRPNLQELFQSPGFQQRPYWDGGRVREAYQTYCDGRSSVGQDFWRIACVELWHRHCLP